MQKVRNMLRCALIVLLPAVLSGGCEEKIPLATASGTAGVELRVVNSFIDEMAVLIDACQQSALIEAGTTAVIECDLADAADPFAVEIAWPAAPLNEQGAALFPPQTATVAAGQSVRIGIAPEGVKGGFRIRVVEQ